MCIATRQGANACSSITGPPKIYLPYGENVVKIGPVDHELSLLKDLEKKERN